MSLRTLIVDDEPLARRGLRLRLERAADVEILGEAGNGREALERINELKPDLVFLDIQMPGMSGFDVLRALPATAMPMIVFVTAFDEFAVAAFEARALDYLLKPIDDERLAQAVDRARRSADAERAVAHRDDLVHLVAELTGETAESVEEVLAAGQRDGQTPYLGVMTIKDGRKVVRVDVKSIDWIDAAGDYMCVHADGKTYVMRGTMKKLEEHLNPLWFQRVHRSTIVNVHRVTELRPHMNGEYFLRLSCGSEIKLSRHYRDKLKHFLPSSS
jgi:two-component system LytT family response regulator